MPLWFPALKNPATLNIALQLSGVRPVRTIAGG